MDAGRLLLYLQAQGFPVIGVRVGDRNIPQTWSVECPANTPIAVKDTAASAAQNATEAQVDAVMADSDAQRDVTAKAIKTLVYWVLRRLLGRNPTAQELQDARTELLAIYKQM